MKKYWILLFPLVILVSTVAAQAQPSAYGVRDIQNQNLAAGSFTNITVAITNNLSQALSLMENLPSRWTLTRISDDADSFKASTNEWVWFNVGEGVTKTAVYRINAPANASSGTYYINGSISNSSGIITITAGENTINVASDTTPPASITNLANISYAQNYINWTWSDPTDLNFYKVMIYLDGSFKTNVSKGVQYYNATGFALNTTHTIATRTVDTSGNINQTWVNHTAKTALSDATTSLKGDINGDCKVDYKDLAILGAAYGTLKGDAGYNAAADLNGDDKVDYRDLVILGANYGKTC